MKEDVELKFGKGLLSGYLSAVHLPLIDMMFGTHRCPKGKWPDEYGIVSGEPTPSFWKQLLHPFRRPKRKDDS